MCVKKVLKKNLKAGEGSPYWYEWSVGLLYLVKMLNPDNNIRHVVLQSEDSQSLDDVVVTYENGIKEFIQVKHTREDDKLSYSDMLEGGTKESYLYKYSSEWKNTDIKNKVVLFTNREIGNRKRKPKNEWERPPLSLFWKSIKSQAEGLLEEYKNINDIVVDDKWQKAFSVWKEHMSELDENEQLLFIKNFDLVTGQDDLDKLVESIAKELQNTFRIQPDKAINLHQKLCYKLIWWATCIGSKKEIEKEDVMQALCLGEDNIKGNHVFPICEPFFPSRIKLIDKLENTILNGNSRMIFLTGGPGCGKTNVISYLSSKPGSIVTLRFHVFKPIMPGDLYMSADTGISDPKDFWGTLLIMLRKLFAGRLFEYKVPISIELIDSIDELRNEVLRLSSAWAEITGVPTVISIDGIDHAIRSGNKNTFLKTLVPPYAIPGNVRIILAGQPTYQFTEYPDFLSDKDIVERVELTDIEIGDLELLYETNLSQMKYSEEEKKLVINYIAHIAKGNTLSAVFAMKEATKYIDFIQFEAQSSAKYLSSGIQPYYEYIWKTALFQVKDCGHPKDMYLSAVFSTINKKVSAKNMAEIFGDDITIAQWEDILQNLFPIIQYNEQGYSVFHNDVRVFLTTHYKKADQLLPEINGKIADFLMNQDFDKNIKHEIIFKLLKDAGKEEKYVDVFTDEYVIEAYLLRRSPLEIYKQMEDTLAVLPKIKDKKKILTFSCAVTTMWQHDESLKWLDTEYQHDFELPFALNSEIKPIIENLLSLNDFTNMFNDIKILIQKNEYTRAKRVFERWMNNRGIDNLVSYAQNDESYSLDDLLELWGKYARMFKVTPLKIEYEQELNQKVALFYSGWLKESVNYTGNDELEYSLKNTALHFKTDIEEYFKNILSSNRIEDIELILINYANCNEEVFSERNKLLACIWSIQNNKTELCKNWIQEIIDKEFDYISEEWYLQLNPSTQKNEKFRIHLQIMYILNYETTENFNTLKNNVLKKCDIKVKDYDFYGASNILFVTSKIAKMENYIAQNGTDKLDISDFKILLNMILDDKYYKRYFIINSMVFRKIFMKRIIDIVSKLPSSFKEILLNSLCNELEKQSRLEFFEVYWEYLHMFGKDDLLKSFFDAWILDKDGKIWGVELSERRYIYELLLEVANKLNWQERSQRANELLSLRSISYVGRKDYSLYTPLWWFKRVAEKQNEIWQTSGMILMSLSEYASQIGDNRAFIEISSTVAEYAGKMGKNSLLAFAKSVQNVKNDWVDLVFDGIISALEYDFFTEEELLEIWKKTIKYYPMARYETEYNYNSNTISKIYCADVHEAIKLCSNRLNYSGLEVNMNIIAPFEFKQKRLEVSEHNCIIPYRWYENEYSDYVLQLIENTEQMNCDELFSYIENQNVSHSVLWTWLKYFIQVAEKREPQIIKKYKPKILAMLSEREYMPLYYDGCNRLYDAIFPYLTDDEVVSLLEDIIIYYIDRQKNLSEIDYGLMSDLEYFAFALFSRFDNKDSLWGLQELLKMHCNWVNGTNEPDSVNIFQLSKQEDVLNWIDFWDKL